MTDRPLAPVSDHAVLRWLERECDVPVERIRQLIGEGCAPYAHHGTVAVIVGRIKFIIEGGVVVTTLERRMRQRGRNGRARRRRS